jgi:hypothetical protein
MFKHLLAQFYPLWHELYFQTKFCAYCFFNNTGLLGRLPKFNTSTSK